MKRLLLIINPTIKKTALINQLFSVIDTFCRAGYDVSVYSSKSASDLQTKVRKSAPEFDLVVCSGGDGTLNLTANALYMLDSPPPLSFIPAGTTNDFAQSRGISCVPTEAAKAIINGYERKIDLGFFGRKAFVYIAAFGVFSDVSYLTPRQMKQNIGHAAYVLEGIKSLSKITPYTVRFICDEGVIEGEFIYGMITNTLRVGGFELPIMRNASLDDGFLEVTLVRNPRTVADNQRLINALVTQMPDGRVVYQFKTRSIRYVCTTQIPWTLDGENGGRYKKNRISIIPGAITMKY